MSESSNNSTVSTEHLDNLEMRAFRYEAQDGLVEFLSGIMFFFIARVVVDPHLAWMPALLLFPMRWAAKFFKTRFTYPRMGYVKFKSENGSDFGRGVLTFLLGVLVLMALALWIFGDISSWDQWMKWLPTMMAGFCSGGFIYMAERTRLPRHYFLIVFCLCWGVACSLMDVPSPHHAIQRWTLGLGLVLLVMGTTIFLNFLRTHPVRQPEVNDEQV